MDERAGETVERQGMALKRRGLIAGAAALVAGLVTKQAAQPVAAISGGGDEGALVLASNPWYKATGDHTNSPNQSYIATVVQATPNFQNYILTNGAEPVVFKADASTAGGGDIDGLRGVGKGNGTGVYGESIAGAGVYGNSSAFGASGAGVIGAASGYNAILGILYAPPNSGYAGVYGYGNGNGTYGVYGYGYTGRGVGVQGQGDAATGVGVKGISTSGFPAIGVATGGANANAGVLGVGTLGPGVQGQSYAGHGLVGTTAATDGQHAALIGSVQTGGNAVALRGSVPSGATGLAGVFDGDVTINGALRVYGSPKNAAVKHPGDGTYRLLYCMESPESWFEDFGAGKLVNGMAAVKLDSDFAALVHTEEYHVFLTSHDPTSKGLAVAGMRAEGFTVQEHAGGTSGGTFSWRVVAKRKDIAGERLAKVPPPPPLKPVTPFTVPETPEPKPPSKKP